MMMEKRNVCQSIRVGVRSPLPRCHTSRGRKEKSGIYFSQKKKEMYIMSKVNVCLHREQRASATRHRFIQAHYHVCCMYQAHAFRNDITMKSQILFFLSSNMKCITQRERSEKMRNKMRNLAIWWWAGWGSVGREEEEEELSMSTYRNIIMGSWSRTLAAAFFAAVVVQTEFFSRSFFLQHTQRPCFRVFSTEFSQKTTWTYRFFFSSHSKLCSRSLARLELIRSMLKLYSIGWVNASNCMLCNVE